MNSKKKVLEYARNIILGTGSFDYFQNLCDEYRKEASQKKNFNGLKRNQGGDFKSFFSVTLRKKF